MSQTPDLDATDPPAPGTSGATPVGAEVAIDADDTVGSGLHRGDDGLVRPAWASVHDDLREYYDTEWGVPVRDERGVFERLSLEGFQSGLSWATILRRREGFRRAFADFEVDAVAAFDETDVERLLGDAGIIRHRGKITATIGNARAAQELRSAVGLGAQGALGPGSDLARLVWSYRPEVTPVPRLPSDVPSTSPASIALARELKARGFRFVGPTTMFALMEAIGLVDTHLVGSHRRGASGLWQDDGTARP